MGKLTLIELEKCNKVKETYYCDEVHILSKKKSCEKLAIEQNSRKLEEICGTKIVLINEIVFIKTFENNKFITIAPEKQFGKLMKNEGFEIVEFIGTQTLEINEEANLYLNSMEVKFLGDNLKTDIRKSLSTKLQVNISDFKVEEKESKNGITIFDKPAILSANEFVKLGQMSHKLTEKLEQRIKEKKEIIKNNYGYYITIGIIVTVVTGVLALLAGLVIKKMKSWKRTLENVTEMAIKNEAKIKSEIVTDMAVKNEEKIKLENDRLNRQTSVDEAHGSRIQQHT